MIKTTYMSFEMLLSDAVCMKMVHVVLKSSVWFSTSKLWICSPFKLNVVISSSYLLFTSWHLVSVVILQTHKRRMDRKEWTGNWRTVFNRIKRMNILSLVVHGQKEVPELGVLSHNIETPEGVYHSAVLGECATSEFLFWLSSVEHILF